MKIFLDTADVNEIREGWESGLLMVLPLILH